MCRTLSCGEHLYDSGAHRFHDRDPEITRDLLDLMGDDLVRVDAPSAIRDRGRYIDFPPTPAERDVRVRLPRGGPHRPRSAALGPAAPSGSVELRGFRGRPLRRDARAPDPVELLREAVGPSVRPAVARHRDAPAPGHDAALAAVRARLSGRQDRARGRQLPVSARRLRTHPRCARRHAAARVDSHRLFRRGAHLRGRRRDEDPRRGGPDDRSAGPGRLHAAAAAARPAARRRRARRSARSRCPPALSARAPAVPAPRDAARLGQCLDLRSRSGLLRQPDLRAEEPFPVDGAGERNRARRGSPVLRGRRGGAAPGRGVRGEGGRRAGRPRSAGSAHRPRDARALHPQCLPGLREELRPRRARRPRGPGARRPTWKRSAGPAASSTAICTTSCGSARTTSAS